MHYSSARNSAGSCSLYRVIPVQGELYGATVLRMANVNGVRVHRLLGTGSETFRDVARVRDHGEAVDRFAAFFDDAVSLGHRLRRVGTLLGYYLGDRLEGNPSTRLCARSALRRGAALSYCRECAREDRARWGTATWRIEHQLPLTKACWKHECALVEVRMPSGLELPPGYERDMPVDSGRKWARDLIVHLSQVEASVWRARVTNEAYTGLVRELKGRIGANGVYAISALVGSTYGSLRTDTVFAAVCEAGTLELRCEQWQRDPPEDADPITTTLILAALKSGHQPVTWTASCDGAHDVS